MLVAASVSALEVGEGVGLGLGVVELVDCR